MATHTYLNFCIISLFKDMLYACYDACHGLPWCSHTFVLTVFHRDLPDQHPENRGGEPRLPEEARQGAHQLQQAAESSRDHRRDPAVPEPALLLTGRERYQGKARFTHHRPQYSFMGIGTT